MSLGTSRGVENTSGVRAGEGLLDEMGDEVVGRDDIATAMAMARRQVSVC
jgi:hypothetical protein